MRLPLPLPKPRREAEEGEFRVSALEIAKAGLKLVFNHPYGLPLDEVEAKPQTKVALARGGGLEARGYAAWGDLDPEHVTVKVLFAGSDTIMAVRLAGHLALSFKPALLVVAQLPQGMVPRLLRGDASSDARGRVPGPRLHALEGSGELAVVVDGEARRSGLPRSDEDVVEDLLYVGWDPPLYTVVYACNLARARLWSIG